MPSVAAGPSPVSYEDIGISGTKEKRPEHDRLMADAHRPRFDVVAVWKFDRMARSVSHLLRALETFNSLGIEFVSLSESLDTATPAGRMVCTVLGAVAEPQDCRSARTGTFLGAIESELGASERSVRRCGKYSVASESLTRCLSAAN